MAKVKVKNDNKFNVGIRFEDGTQRELVIRSGNTIPMDEIDIMNVDASSQLFKRGILTIIEEKERVEELGVDPDNPNAITEEEIRKILKLNGKQMRSRLENIDAKHAIGKVINVAKDPETNLPQSKIKIVNELFDINLFEELGDDKIV